jgi:hypothetical protein
MLRGPLKNKIKQLKSILVFGLQGIAFPPIPAQAGMGGARGFKS